MQGGGGRGVSGNARPRNPSMADYVEVNMSTDFILSILCPRDISSRNILLESTSFLPGVTDERLGLDFDQVEMRCNCFAVDTSSMPQAFYSYDVKIFKTVSKDGADYFVCTDNEGVAEKKDFALKGDINENLDIIKSHFSTDSSLNQTSGISAKHATSVLWLIRVFELRWFPDWNGL